MSLKIRRAPRSAALACGSLFVAGCSMLGSAAETRPAAAPALVVGEGTSVTVGNDQSGRPVELRADQALTVRLKLAGSAMSDWSLVDFTPGVLTPVGGTRFEQDTTAARYGEIAGTQSWRFAASKPGQTTLRFELRVPRSREPATAAATFDVTVR